MKNILFLFFLFQSYLFAFAQNKHEIDSLQTVLQSTNDDTSKAVLLISISKEYQGFNSSKAFEFGNKALSLSQNINFKKGIGNSHNNLGDIYWYNNDFASASDHYLKALNIFEQLNNKVEIASCFRNIGWVYYHQNNLEQALDYYSKSLEINLEMNHKIGLGHNYNDIAIIYIDQKEYSKAIENLNKSVAIEIELNSKGDLIANYNNLADAYANIGKIDLAIVNIKKSIDIAQTDGNKQNLSLTYCNLGAYYTHEGKFDLALQSINKGLRYAKEINYKIAIKDCYQNYAELYSIKKEYAKAYAYADSLSNIKDTIYNENNSRQVNEMTTKYDSEKKELMINSLEKDKALSAEKLQREKNFKIYLSIFCFMIVVIAFILFRGNVQKKKVNSALSSAYKEIEVKNKDITDSINYSKRIQEASLPPIELKYKLFPNAFVLFKPKDIVSGDFYWYAEKDGKRLIAACDCTGHGVPGALMSMIGNNILNQIVNEKGVTAPDQILNHLHAEIRKALKQNEHQESRDGMDIALVVFNGEDEIEFSGAQRPLWIITNDNNKAYNPTLKEIKGNKFSIGGMQTEAQRIFSNTKVKLSKGDSIYFFTDGYVDQFGGEQGKKFMSKNFKELLLTIHTEPMAMQEIVLTKTLEKWINKHEQVDDILVIGIKI